MDAVESVETPARRAQEEQLQPKAGRLPSNIVRDMKTVAAMVEIYCRDKHGTKGDVCPDCAALLAYAHLRLEKCPYGSHKTTCRECPTHCYRTAQRTAIANVMRHAGPRMLRRHLLLALRHLWIDRKGAPKRPAAHRAPNS
jgi:hypothetical protein